MSTLIIGLLVIILAVLLYLVWVRTSVGNASEIVVVPTSDWWGPNPWPGGSGWWPRHHPRPITPPTRHPLGPGGEHRLGPGGEHRLGPGGEHRLGPGGQHRVML